MTPTRIEEELLELERQYWQAMKDRDVEAALRLTDFPCVVAGPSGIGLIEKQAFTAMMKDAPYRIKKMDLDPEAKVRLIRDDVAVVAYKIHGEVSVDGKSVKVDASDSSTWIKRNGRWACAHHTEAITGDPWGREQGKAEKKPS